MYQGITKHIEKIVVNTGIGRLSNEGHFKDKILPSITKDFAVITGQKPSLRVAKKSIAGFKLREGQVVGMTSTLRGQRMGSFLDRLTKIVFPRVRDFRGIKLSNIDSGGNLTVGIKENIIFPEVTPEDVPFPIGLQVTIVPKDILARDEVITLYRSLGIPLQKE